jgi:hypothetical protein
LQNADHHNPGWMSADGLTIYGDRTVNLLRSRDDCETWQTVKAFARGVAGVRELDNGELLVSIYGDGLTLPGELWRSTDYPTLDTGCSWTKVLTCGSGPSSYIEGMWGMSASGDVVCAAEYGLKNPPTDGARYAYLSTDAGLTFTQIYDHGTNVGSHVHGIAYDPWWSAIWLVAGDGAFRTTQVSFDNGANWTEVSSAYQPVGIIPLEDCILFVNDAPPNGVMRIDRSGGQVGMTMQTALVIDPAATLTMIGGMPYRHETGDPVLLPFFPNVASKGSELWMTYDGITFEQLWQDTATGVTERGLYKVVGPTASGYLFGQSNDGRQTSLSRLTLVAP